MRLSGLLGMIVISAGISMISPFLLRDLLDNVLSQGSNLNTRTLTLLVAGMVAIPIVTGVIGVAQTWQSNLIGQQVMHDLRASVYTHLQRLSLAFFTRTRTGEVQSRIANDIGGVQTVVTTTATSIASNVTTVLATTIAMAVLDWRLTLASFAILPLFVWMTRRVGRVRKALAATMQGSLADISTLVEGDDPGHVRDHACADVRHRRLRDGARRHRRLDRHAGGVHDAADAPAVPDRLAAERAGRPADLDGAVRPGVRVPRPAGRDRGTGRPGAFRPGPSGR